MRRRLLIGGAALGGFLLVSLCCLWLFYGRIGEWVLRDKVLPKVEARLGRSVDIGEIEVGRGEVTLKRVVIAGDAAESKPLISVDRIVVTYDYGASWFGNVVVHDLTLYGLNIHAEKRADGSDNFRELADRLRGKDKTADGKSRSSGFSRLRPRSVKIVGGSLDFVDEAKGAQVHASGLSSYVNDDSDRVAVAGFETLSLQPGTGPMLTLGACELKFDISDPLASARVDVSGGQVTLWKGMSLTGITGQVAPGDTLDQLIIDLHGSYGGSTEKLWQAQGWLEPKAKRGQLDVKAARFTLNRISSVLEGTMIRDYENTSIDAELSIELENGKADLSGNLDLTGLSFQHAKLADEVVSDVSFKADVLASFDLVARTIKLASMSLVSKGVNYQLSGSMALRGGVEADGSIRQFPRLDFRGVVPVTDCQAVLDSIPAQIIPKLQGFRLKGPFHADVRLAIDWGDLEKTVLDGTIDLPKCSVLSPAVEFNTGRLMSGFEHQTLVGPNQYESVEIGMASPNYVQIFDISSYFLNALLTHEDSRFYKHHGFITREFRTALIRNLETGAFKRGASSITMQMVKNVFLYRDKTMSRKLQELFLTWYVEKTLDKNRIFEIYVNAIEYGPGIYGVVKAADTYFGKHPRDLSPIEAAFLAQLLPAPRKRYFQYCKDKLSKRTSSKMGRLLVNMNKRGRLTDEELAEAKDATLEFNPDKERELCRKIPSW